MEYELYIDVFVLTNFGMDLIALLFVNQIRQGRSKIRWLLLASGLGSLFGMILLLTVPNYQVYKLLMHGVVNPMILYVAFREQRRRSFLREWAMMYIAVMLEGGVVQWIGRGSVLGEHMPLLLLGVAGVMGIVSLQVNRQNHKEGEIYEVELTVKGKKWNLQALYDTGNLLKDPFVGLPVQIVEKNRLLRVLGDEPLSIRQIPFSALGTKNGLLEVVTGEKLLIKEKDGVQVVAPVVLGLTKEDLFQNRGYEMILNAYVR